MLQSLVVSPLKTLIGITALIALVSIPTAVALNTAALRAVSVTIGATAENAKNASTWIDQGRAEAAGRASTDPQQDEGPASTDPQQ